MRSSSEAHFGYFMQPKKCILIVKEGREDGAKKFFGETGVVMSTGARHLGAVLGSRADKLKYVDEKVKDWVREIGVLSKIAVTEPHAAFAAFTHCLQAKWNFLSRTIPGVGELLIDVETAIREKFIPSLLRKEVSDDIRRLLAIPARFGGLGIFNPTERSPVSFEHSTQLCAPLVSLILRQEDTFEPKSLREEQKLIRIQQDAALDQEHEHQISTHEIAKTTATSQSQWQGRREHRVGSQPFQTQNTTQFCIRETF